VRVRKLVICWVSYPRIIHLSNRSPAHRIHCVVSEIRSVFVVVFDAAITATEFRTTVRNTRPPLPHPAAAQRHRTHAAGPPRGTEPSVFTYLWL